MNFFQKCLEKAYFKQNLALKQQCDVSKSIAFHHHNTTRPWPHSILIHLIKSFQTIFNQIHNTSLFTITWNIWTALLHNIHIHSLPNNFGLFYLFRDWIISSNELICIRDPLGSSNGDIQRPLFLSYSSLLHVKMTMSRLRLF